MVRAEPVVPVVPVAVVAICRLVAKEAMGPRADKLWIPMPVLVRAGWLAAQAALVVTAPRVVTVMAAAGAPVTPQGVVNRHCPLCSCSAYYS